MTRKEFLAMAVVSPIAVLFGKKISPALKFNKIPGNTLLTPTAIAKEAILAFRKNLLMSESDKDWLRGDQWSPKMRRNLEIQGEYNHALDTFNYIRGGV